MTTQDQIVHSEEVIYETEEVVCLTLESAPQCSFDSIPNELIEYHIFGYFWFHYWTQQFVSVCKRWKQICENSTITPKHIRISFKHDMDVGKAILWVKKYQPTILELNFNKIQSSALGSIHELVGASECIDILSLNNVWGISLLKPSSALARIRTLVLNTTFGPSNGIFQLFPALQRLQVQSCDISTRQNIPVKELTIIGPNEEFYLQRVDVPKLTLISDNKVIKRVDGKITELRMSDMTYEEYFRYFGKTKMFVMLSRLNFTTAKMLLDTSTSYDYEADLIENNLFGYKYPTNTRVANYDAIFMNDYGEYYKQHPDLVSWRKLPISDNFKFIRLTYTGEVHSAVAILAKLGAKIITEIDGKTAVRVQYAFFELLSHPQVDKRIFNDSNVREAAKAILVTVTKYQGKRGYDLLSTAQQFEKIPDLMDWSEANANINDYDLFWAMIKKGAKIPYRTFSDLALHAHAGTQFSKILYELTKRDPLVWHEILNNISSQKLF